MNLQAAVPSEAPFRELPFIERDIVTETRADGTLILRLRQELSTPAPHIPYFLRRNAATRPRHTWLAQRVSPEGDWRRLSYGQAREQVDAVTQFLLERNPSGRPVMVLSGNSIEHAVLQLAAMQARMPHVPVTPAYSLLSQDLVKLKAMFGLVQPGVVFVQNGKQFGRALAGLPLEDAEVLAVDDMPSSVPGAIAWRDVLQTVPGDDVERSVSAIDHDTVAKYMFTSGSTGTPKAAIITQGNLCFSQRMHDEVFVPSSDLPEVVMLDWLPWSHIAGGVGVFNYVLREGGTLYIDEGRPTLEAFPQTLRNLREVSPVRFGGMPLSYGMLADALEQDDDLGERFFRNMRRLVYSGSRLPDDLYARIQALAVRHTGHRIPFLSAYGSTETTAALTYVYWHTVRTGLIGLPHPGVTLKLVPLADGRYEIRARSPAISPGYLKQPQLTADARDDEGFFCMGDAAAYADQNDIRQGLVFAGRVAEEFKLQSGIFVRVGTLRVEVLGSVGGLLSDVVVTGADQPWVGALAWLNLEACRLRFHMRDASAAELIRLPALREVLRTSLQAYNATHPASSMRVRRLALLAEPPSIDAGEITDKGYINQRTVLTRRHSVVDRMYAPSADDEFLDID